MLEFHIRTQASVAEFISEELTWLGADAVTWLDAANQPIYEPMPGEIIPWQEINIVALCSNQQLVPALQSYLAQQHKLQAICSFHSKDVESKDWVRASLDQFQPIQFGERLWICPSWQVPPQPHAVNVKLDPGLAFGTGMHATTAMCLEWLAKHISGNEVLIDYGCGSGILAIAALKLGAEKAYAIDHDPQALEATRLNGELNGLTDSCLTVCQPGELQTVQADLVIANILAKPLQELSPLFYAFLKPGGKVVLSGILATQVEEVSASYANYFQMQSVYQQGEWVCLDGYKQAR